MLYKSFSLFLALIVVLVVTSLAGCAEPPSPRSIVLALIDHEKSTVDGQLYVLSADEGDADYISDTTLLSIYGFDRSLDGLREGALYLSGFAHPCEFAVFLCHSSYAAEDVALYLSTRLDTLYDGAYENAKFASMSTEEYRTYIEKARVIISGETVALIISSDSKEAENAFYRAS